jgi:excisionase family DNA binding protein
MKTPMLDNIKVLSPQEVAEQLGHKVPFIKRLLRTGELKGFKTGKFWRTTQSDVDAYIKNCVEAGNTKNLIGKETMAKFQFHGGLRTKKSAPVMVERMEAKIQEIMLTLPEEDEHSKIPAIAKLKALIKTNADKRKQVDSIPGLLEQLADEAYPGIRQLINEDPGALVAMFLSDAEEDEVLERAVVEIDAEAVVEGAQSMVEYSK